MWRATCTWGSLWLPLDLEPVEKAAEAVARREDEITYYGIDELEIAGLQTALNKAARVSRLPRP